MNSEELRQRSASAAANRANDDAVLADDDLKTPTVEELAFPGQKVVMARANCCANLPPSIAICSDFQHHSPPLTSGAVDVDGGSSTSSSGSIGSSSGYGSQNTIVKAFGGEDHKAQQAQQGEFA